MDYDFRSSGASTEPTATVEAAGTRSSPTMMAYNRLMGRGKKLYADWMGQALWGRGSHLGEFVAGDPRKDILGNTAIYFSGGSQGARIGVELTVNDSRTEPGMYRATITYSINNKAEKYDEKKGLTLEDFKNPGKILDISILRQLDARLKGTYSYEAEIEAFRQGVMKDMQGLIARAETAQEALFLAQNLKHKEDIPEILSVLERLQMDQGYLGSLAQKILEGKLEE